MRKLDHSKLPQGTLAFPVLVCKSPTGVPTTGLKLTCEFRTARAIQRNSVSKKKKSDTIRANVRIYCTIIAFANFKIILSIKKKKKKHRGTTS